MSKKLKEQLNDVDEIVEINTGDILEFKEISHEIAENFMLICAKLDELEIRIQRVEDQELFKGLTALEKKIARAIRQHSEVLLKEQQQISVNPPSDYTSEIIARLKRERNTDSPSDVVP